MTITAERISDTEVKAGEKVYTFESKAGADAFQQCLGADSPETCVANHPAISTRSAVQSDASAELKPGSIISPSMGGMP